MNFETIEIDIEDGIFLLTLNRPEKLNAFNPTMREEMTQLLPQLALTLSQRPRLVQRLLKLERAFNEARAYTQENNLPVIGCCCPACGDLSLKRQRLKRLLLDFEAEHPGVKSSMLKALGNVAPRHLLDTRLNPVTELRASGAPKTIPTDGGPFASV